MNRLQLTTTGVWLSLMLAACSSETPSSSNGGVGGNPPASSNMGGALGSTTGGAKAAGGSLSGTQIGATGGTKAGSGGSPSGATTGIGQTGGASPTGGASSSGGNPTVGGAPATGGKSSVGGTPGTGGASVSAGGASTVAQGGTRVTVGGSAATGGTSAAATGGANTGGASSAASVPQLITSDQTSQWKTGTYTVVTSGTADITVGTSGGQSYVGFGGTFNEAGWDAMKALSDADRAAVMKALFSADGGINFAWGRIPIGASDYALTWYSLDDTANDTTMSKFSIDHDKTNLIPFIDAALDVKSDIKFWGSPWTPPAWMKSNNSLDSVTGKTAPYAATDGYMKSDDANLTAFALYLEKFVQEYGKLTPAIKISAVVPQNEPGYGNPYPSCYWDSATFVKFVGQFLGPQFAKDGITADIWAGTMSAPADGNIAVAAWNDASAKTYLKGSGLQWNTFDKCPTLKGKGMLVLTEHKCGNYNFSTKTPKGDYTPSSTRTSVPPNDYNYGIESWYEIRDWLQAGVNSYNAWNMVLDTNGLNNNSGAKWPQNSLIVVDKAAKKFNLTPAYYVFRHISQYLKLPATLINTSGDYLAFKNADGSYVVAIYNKGAAKNMIVSVNNKMLQFAAPGNGWATINVQ